MSTLRIALLLLLMLAPLSAAPAPCRAAPGAETAARHARTCAGNLAALGEALDPLTFRRDLAASGMPTGAELTAAGVPSDALVCPGGAVYLFARATADVLLAVPVCPVHGDAEAAFGRAEELLAAVAEGATGPGLDAARFEFAAGRYGAALEALRASPASLPRDALLAEIVTSASLESDRTVPLDAAALLGEPAHRSVCLAETTRKWMDAGDLPAAAVALAGVSDRSLFEQGALELARAFERAGDLPAAASVIGTLEARLPGDGARAEAAVLLDRIGQGERALALLDRAADPRAQALALPGILARSIAAGGEAAVPKLLNRLTDPSARALVALSTVGAWKAKGDAKRIAQAFRHARSLAAAIPEPGERAQVLILASAGMAAEGYPALAAESLREAGKLVDALPKTRERRLLEEQIARLPAKEDGPSNKNGRMR